MVDGGRRTDGLPPIDRQRVRRRSGTSSSSPRSSTLALVTLPYARRRPVAIDRWTSYAIVAGVAWLAFAYRIVDLAAVRPWIVIDQPTDVIVRIPGLWLTAIGLAVLARAVYEMLGEPGRR